MKFSIRVRNFWVFVLTIMLSNLPQASLAAKMDLQMIPTAEVVQEISRSQALELVDQQLSRSDVQKALLAKGLSADEISARLNSLSDSELQQLVGQVNQAQYGGDILVAVLIVVLIIYFAKRISLLCRIFDF